MSSRQSLQNVPVDVLEGLRRAIFGCDLLLVAGDQGLRLYEIAGGRAYWLGSFSDAAPAWEAVDAVDLARLPVGRLVTPTSS